MPYNFRYFFSIAFTVTWLGSGFHVLCIADSGSTGLPSFTEMKNSTISGKPVASGSTTHLSDDDELEEEADTTKNADGVHMKRMKR